MNCREVLAKLYDYLDEELTASDRQDLQKHLEHCSDCLHKYNLEEQFNRVIAGKVNSPCETSQLKKRILVEIAKIDQQGGAASAGSRNVLYLFLPIAAAALVALILINPFSSKGSVLEAVYPFAHEHSKCLDHVMQYIVQSHDPSEVKAALQHIGAMPDDLFAPATDGQFQLAGAAIAHVNNHDRVHLDYSYKGDAISVFVLDKNTIDKSHFERIEHDGKTLFAGSCPKFQYVIWECETHECVAVSLIDEEKLIDFASVF